MAEPVTQPQDSDSDEEIEHTMVERWAIQDRIENEAAKEGFYNNITTSSATQTDTKGGTTTGTTTGTSTTT